MTYIPQRALELLRIGSGRGDATFRDGQEEAIHHIVDGRGRLLVVQKTGWGKSFVYFIATKLLREVSNGPAAALDVSNAQAKVWLKHLIDEGVIAKQEKPVGYIVKQSNLFE